MDSISTTDGMKNFLSENFHSTVIGRNDDMEAEYHRSKITGLRKKVRTES